MSNTVIKTIRIPADLLAEMERQAAPALRSLNKQIVFDLYRVYPHLDPTNKAREKANPLPDPKPDVAEG